MNTLAAMPMSYGERPSDTANLPDRLRPRTTASVATAAVLILSSTSAPAAPALAHSFEVETKQILDIDETKQNFRTQARAPLNRVVSAIRNLSQLQPGWNGAESKPPAQAAIDDAERFAAGLDWSKIKLPHVSSADDGEINLFWRSDSVYCDIGFFGDGTYSFFAQDADGSHFTGDHIPARSELPKPLFELLLSTSI